MSKEVERLKKLSLEERAKKIRELLSEKTKKELKELEEITLRELKENKEREEDEAQESKKRDEENLRRREKAEDIEEKLADAPKFDTSEEKSVVYSSSNQQSYSATTSYEGIQKEEEPTYSRIDSEKKKEKKHDALSYERGSQFD